MMQFNQAQTDYLSIPLPILHFIPVFCRMVVSQSNNKNTIIRILCFINIL